MAQPSADPRLCTVEAYEKVFKSLFPRRSSQKKFGVTYHLLEGARIQKAGATALYRLTISNESNMVWHADEKNEGLRGISISYHWYTLEGSCIIWDGIRTPLPSPVSPGKVIKIDVQVKVPEEPGTYQLVIDLVQEGITWFSWNGSDPLDLTVEVLPGVIKIDHNMALKNIPYLFLSLCLVSGVRG